MLEYHKRVVYLSNKKKLYMETIQDIKSKAKFILYRYAGERIQITHVGDVAYSYNDGIFNAYTVESIGDDTVTHSVTYMFGPDTLTFTCDIVKAIAAFDAAYDMIVSKELIN